MKPIPGAAFTRRVIGCASRCIGISARDCWKARRRPAYATNFLWPGCHLSANYASRCYEGRTVEEYSQMDVIVEETLALEIKAVHQVHPIHVAQLRTYLVRLVAELQCAAKERRHLPHQRTIGRGAQDQPLMAIWAQHCTNAVERSPGEPTALLTGRTTSQ